MKLLAVVLSLTFLPACDSPSGGEEPVCRTTERMICDMGFACESTLAETTAECMEMLQEETPGGPFCQFGNDVDFTECRERLTAAKIECAKPEDEREHWSRITTPAVMACLQMLGEQ